MVSRPGGRGTALRRTNAGPDDPYWVVLIRGAETEGGFLQYHFSATDADGAELVSEIYALTFDSVASNGVQAATDRN